MTDCSEYFIKQGYRSRPEPTLFNDTESDSLTYQLEVYRYAAERAKRIGADKILDIGCGVGLKLKTFIHPLGVSITGIDTPHAIDYCKSNHEFGEWHTTDLENPDLAIASTFDLIICSDVIEHMINPDTLLALARSLSHHDTEFVISTPERDLRRGPSCMGPPGNPAHVREWNQQEFLSYLKSRDFQILDHLIVDLKEGMRTCQLVLCRPYSKL